MAWAEATLMPAVNDETVRVELGARAYDVVAFARRIQTAVVDRFERKVAAGAPSSPARRT